MEAITMPAGRPIAFYPVACTTVVTLGDAKKIMNAQVRHNYCLVISTVDISFVMAT